MNNRSFSRKQTGFTMIELVIVIAIIGILAALALPKYIDMTGASKEAATKAGLGALRSVLATRYAASGTGGAVATYPTSLGSSDFAGGEVPKNQLNNFPGVTALTNTVSGTATSPAGNVGFWYVTDSSNVTNYGQAGAYSDGTTNTSAY